MSSSHARANSLTLISAHQPARQCRKILQKQIAAASVYLSTPTPDVHAARKQLKRTRATLRLLRPSIGRAAYEREDAGVRDFARRLSAARDSEVLLATLKRLTRRSRTVAHLPLESLHASLQRRRTAQALQARQRRALVRRLQALIEHRAVADGGWDCLAHGLGKTYRRGRREFREALTEGSSDRLHAWRKQAQYLWYQLQILAPLAPGVIGESGRQFHRLSEYLGEEHDLTALRAAVLEPGRQLDPKTVGALLEAIDERRARLRSRAFALGERLYAEKTSAFVAGFDARWRKWARA